MLRIIYGEAGTGKSSAIMDEIRRGADSGGRYILLVPVSKMSSAVYANVNMLVKCVFYSAERSRLVDHNPAAQICPRGGKPAQPREALPDEQKKILLDTIRGLPPYLFVMIGLYSGLRKEEILGLQWDCVFLDAKAPYIAVRRAWHKDHNQTVVDTNLKTKAAKRDVPIPKCLVRCLQEEKNVSSSQYVISGSNGEPLSESQFVSLWRYIIIRSTRTRKYYRYINGEKIAKETHPILGGHANNNPDLIYTMDFNVTAHMLRHTYITDLIYAGVDPKTVQYLAGHENSKTTMDIYCKLRYNRPEDLRPIVNHAFSGDMGS